MPGAARLTQASVSNTTRIEQRNPLWSPDGAFVAYSEVVSKKNISQSSNIMRMPSSGGTATALTADGKSFANHWQP